MGTVQDHVKHALKLDKTGNMRSSVPRRLLYIIGVVLMERIQYRMGVGAPTEDLFYYGR